MKTNYKFRFRKARVEKPKSLINVTLIIFANIIQIELIELRMNFLDWHTFNLILFLFIFSPNSSCNSDFAMEEEEVYF